MAGPLGSTTPFAAPAYLQSFRPASSMSASRFDEGYSEDTRSQTGSDMVVRTDSRLGEGGMEQDLQYALPEWVMHMSESERSGMYTAMLLVYFGIDSRPRIRVCHPAVTPNLVHRRHCRKTEPSPSPRSCCLPTARDHVPNILLLDTRDPAPRFDPFSNMARSSHG